MRSETRKEPPREPRARGAQELQRAVLTGPQPQCIGLRAAEARQFSAIVWVYGEVEAAILPPYAPLS